VRLASRVEPEWIVPTATAVVHRFDAATGRVRAVVVSQVDSLVIAERPSDVDPQIAATVLADVWLARPPDEATVALVRRAAFAGVELDLPSLARAAAAVAAGLDDIDPARALPYDVRARLDRDAPATLQVPSGRTTALEYRDDGSVVASVKLQELFGLVASPQLGPRRVPVTFSLLAPNGRPVQTTRDLRSFWQGAYQDVRKALRGRYPKHPWPEDPWTAVATHGPTRSLRK
jgi:ATP-dependent helicase HrpB